MRCPQGPYREYEPVPDAPPPRALGTFARDAAVVLALLAAVASIASWSDAVDVFATQVMGFPSVR